MEKSYSINDFLIKNKIIKIVGDLSLRIYTNIDNQNSLNTFMEFQYVRHYAYVNRPNNINLASRSCIGTYSAN